VSIQAAQIAQTAEAAQHAASQASGAVLPDFFQIPDHWPAQGDLLTWCQQIGPGLAALLVLVGVIYLLFGLNIFKALVMLNAACVGAAVGMLIADKANAAEIPLAITGAFIAAVLTWPLMRWAVAIMGGVFGMLLGASLWRAFGLEPTFAWAGGGMGLILFGLLSFILFRGCVMTFMSLQGAVMLVFGVLGLVFKYHEVTPRITSCFALKPFLLPMIVFIATVLGIVYQQNNASPAAQPAKK
jgi:hypothetical protein